MFRRPKRLARPPATPARPGTAVPPGSEASVMLALHEREAVLPTLGLIEQVLDEYGLVHAVDDDGDLVVRWERCAIYVFFYGDQREVVQARLYLNRRFTVEDRGLVAMLLDEWNRTRLFAKAYTVLPDDGLVAVCAEECHDFEGATRAQIKMTIGTWIESLLRFAEWFEEQVDVIPG